MIYSSMSISKMLNVKKGELKMGSPAIVYLTSHEREDVLTALRFWKTKLKYYNEEEFDALFNKIDFAGTNDFKSLKAMIKFYEEN